MRLLVVLCLSLLAVPAWAVTEITSLPATLSIAGETYVVNKGLSSSAGGISITADNITVNGNGFTWTLVSGSAISIGNNIDNATVNDVVVSATNAHFLQASGSNITGLTITGCSAVTTVGELIRLGGAGLQNFTMTDCQLVSTNIDNNKRMVTIGSGANPPFNGVVLRDCYLKGTHTSTAKSEAFYLVSVAEEPNMATGVEIDNCVIHITTSASSPEYIQWEGVDDSWVHDSTFYLQAGSAGAKFTYRSGSDSNTFSDNFFHIVGSGGIFLSGSSGGATHHTTFRNNLIYHTGSEEAMKIWEGSYADSIFGNIILSDHVALDFHDDITSGPNIVTGNTLYCYDATPEAGDAALELSTTINADIVLKNNILLSEGASLINVNGTYTGTLTSDYNDYYQNAATWPMFDDWNLSDYTTLASWPNAGANDISSDPNLAAADTTNWAKRSDAGAAPLTDAGLTSAAIWSLDINGVPRISNSVVDIGPEEYQSGGAPTGRCCYDSGDCVVSTSANCTLSGGTYGGDGTTCAGDPCADSVPPGAVTSLAEDPDSTTTTTIFLRWTAPAEDADSGAAVTSYQFRYALDTPADSLTNFWSASRIVADSPSGPSTPGQQDSLTITSLASGYTFDVAMRSTDGASNESATSNIISEGTTPATGACCFDNGDCSILQALQCSLSNGTYQGDGVACDPCADVLNPSRIDTLNVTATTASSITVQWTNTGEDSTWTPNDRPATTVDIRYSLQIIDSPADFALAAPATGEPAPFGPDTTQTFEITGLDSSTTYYVAMRAIDEASNRSAVSDSTRGTTTGGAPSTGACCTNSGCVTTNQQSCLDEELGTYMGDGVSCSPTPCDYIQGICCLPSTGCSTVMNPITCANALGTWYFAVNGCVGDPCENLRGVCCRISDGNCVSSNALFQSECMAVDIANGGVMWRQGGTCADCQRLRSAATADSLTKLIRRFFVIDE